MSRRQLEADLDAGLLQVLQALQTNAPERLDALLEGVGVPAPDREAAAAKADPRRCTVCGLGYVRCRRVDAHVRDEDQHPWSPDRSRSDA